MPPKKLELAVFISAAMLAIGVFLPLTELPVYGGVSYHDLLAIEPYLVVLAALSGPVLIIMGRIKWLMLSPLAAWLALLFPAIKSLFKSSDESFFGDALNQASAVMQDYAADLFLNIFDFSWGGFVFLAGLISFTIASVMRSLKRR